MTAVTSSRPAAKPSGFATCGRPAPANCGWASGPRASAAESSPTTRRYRSCAPTSQGGRQRWGSSSRAPGRTPATTRSAPSRPSTRHSRCLASRRPWGNRHERRVCIFGGLAALRCYLGSTFGSIRSVKVSVSLPEDDVEFLDSYAQAQGAQSRSAVLHKAVGLLRAAQLADAYEDAWDSWASSDDAVAWETAAADGLGS